MKTALNPVIYLLLFVLSLPVKSQETLSLDGEWELLFDENNMGRESQWMMPEKFDQQTAAIQKIDVPSAWELIRKDYEGVAFYKRTFVVPPEWEGKLIRLQFDAVNYLAEVWVNGEVVGFHEGGFTPFEFRIDEMVTFGKTNILTMRVVGPIILSDKVIDGVQPLETPQWRGGITGGIWQSVNLLATGTTYIPDVFIEPDPDLNSARFHIQMNNTSIRNSNALLTLSIADAGTPSRVILQQKKELVIRPGENQITEVLRIPDPRLWSPDTPNLYHASVSISIDDTLSDEWTDRFGLRQLTVKNKEFYLNGEKIYIKATFFEGLYPNGIAMPDSEEMIRKEIRLAKEAGFNTIRPWRRPPVPRWLDIADEMGVLVIGSPAVECMQLPFSSPYLPSRVENEIREMVLRDRNHPSIVQWELFNELHRPVLKQMMRPMALMTRNLDPTRLILDESGGWAFGANLYLPYEYQPTKFNDIHTYPGPFINKARYDGFLSIGMTQAEKEEAGYRSGTPGRNVVPGLMSYVSELGYGSLPDLTEVNKQFKKEGNPLTPAYRYHQRLHDQQQDVLKESGFEVLYPDMQTYYLDQQKIHGKANKRMIEAVRANPDVAGYCIHALIAGDWIMGAGLIDLWRNPKVPAYESTREANQPRILSIRALPRNIYAQSGTNLEVIGINELKEISGEMKIEIAAADGRVAFNRTWDLIWKNGISTLFDESVETESWEGTYHIKTSILDEKGSLITESAEEIDVWNDQALHGLDAKVQLMGTSSNLRNTLERFGVVFEPFDIGKQGDLVIVSDPISQLEMDQQEHLVNFIKGGGKVLFMGGVGVSDGISENALFTAREHPAMGLWTCIPHLVHDHPLFEGLESGGMMGSMYENVWARKALRDLVPREGMKLEPVVGSVGFDWFSESHEMHYSGPGDSWWGVDVGVLSFGKGKGIVSQLQLKEHLGDDPVADRILLNMIKYLLGLK